MTPLAFFVAGKPQTAGSKTAVPMGARLGVIEAGSTHSRARKRTWRADLRDAALTAAENTSGTDYDLYTQPLAVTFVIVRRRPSQHMRTGQHTGQVKDTALGLQPTQRPDSVKIVRAAEDALTGVIWQDDSQIVRHTIHKAFADQIGLAPLVEGLFVHVSPSDGYMGPQLDLTLNEAA
jgi:Holliday junction resolvase RusA-like endonuclease